MNDVAALPAPEGAEGEGGFDTAVTGQEVRDRSGAVIGIALGFHPDTGPDAGVTHMVPVVVLPEGASLGPVTSPELELAAARAKIAELEASALDKAKQRIAELEADHAALGGAGASSSETAAVPAVDPGGSQ
jgi:hypothetical protein